jgi:hypothetical protein
MQYCASGCLFRLLEMPEMAAGRRPPGLLRIGKNGDRGWSLSGPSLFTLAKNPDPGRYQNDTDHQMQKRRGSSGSFDPGVAWRWACRWQNYRTRLLPPVATGVGLRELSTEQENLGRVINPQQEDDQSSCCAIAGNDGA